MNERPIPMAAVNDPDSVEMARVWIAQNGLHCSLKVGMYKEETKIPEEKAWGMILADIAKHVANALEQEYGLERHDSLQKILANFTKEIQKPTSGAQGDFVKK